jgi:hypothetical protein
LRKTDLGSRVGEAIQRFLMVRLLVGLGEILAVLGAGAFAAFAAAVAIRRAFAATFTSDGRTPTERRISLAEARVA